MIAYALGDGVSGTSASAVANLIPAGSILLMTGDNGYPSGTAANWASYNGTFGSLKTTTWWIPGNHEYGQSAAGPSYTYWCRTAPVHCMGDSGVYNWSVDIGAWHMIGLNSEVSASVGSPQELWLKADLAANTKKCIAALWHEPRWTSCSSHSDATDVQPLVADLVAAHAALILTGHSHQYERFVPMNPSGQPDQTGVTEFVVGTAGNSPDGFTSTPHVGSAARYSGFGVLKLQLSPTGYTYQFIPTTGTFADSGSAVCP